MRKHTPLLVAFLAALLGGAPARASVASSSESYAVVIDQTPAGVPYQAVAEELGRFRSAAALIPLTTAGLGPVFDRLRELKPACVAFVVPPGRVEDNFVGEVFERASRLVEGPELDLAYGFITGATPDDALALVKNTRRAELDRDTIARKFVAVAQTFEEADLGPFAFEQAQLHRRYGYDAVPINPVDGSAEWHARLPREMTQLEGASLVFFAGHGLGESMCGIDADAFTGFKLDRAIVVSGPCHSAVTIVRHDIQPGSLAIKTIAVAPERSICLRLIRAGAVAQFGSTASSSWGNVGPIVTGFFNEAKTLGEACRDRLNNHIRQHGIRGFKILPFVDGQPSPQFIRDERNPGEIQSLARVVLIGDPAYRPFPQTRPVLPVTAMTSRPQPRAPARAKPLPDDLSQVAVADLIAALDRGPSPDFKELNELVRRGKPAVPPLIEALQTCDSWQIPKALGALKDERAVAPLKAALARRPWSPYKEVTSEAIELITGKKL